MKPYKSQFKENDGEMTQEEIKSDTLQALENLKRGADDWAAREYAIKLSSFGFWQKGEMAALGGEEGIKIAREIFQTAIDEINSSHNQSLVNDIYDVVYSAVHKFQERTTREEYGDFEDELERAKELYDEFRSKVDAAFKFDVRQLKMKDLEDKKNQLDFLIDTFEVINDQI